MPLLPLEWKLREGRGFCPTRSRPHPKALDACGAFARAPRDGNASELGSDSGPLLARRAAGKTGSVWTDTAEAGGAARSRPACGALCCLLSSAAPCGQELTVGTCSRRPIGLRWRRNCDHGKASNRGGQGPGGGRQRTSCYQRRKHLAQSCALTRWDAYKPSPVPVRSILSCGETESLP